MLLKEGHLIDFAKSGQARANFPKPDSRRNDMPSSRAARLISEVGRRLMIISRMRSERSRSSVMAERPR